MFLSYQGDSAVLCEVFVLFTTTVIGAVPQEICGGMWMRGAIFHSVVSKKECHRVPSFPASFAMMETEVY